MPSSKRTLNPSGTAPRKRQRLTLDELQWKEVQMPDRLEDYEGFFGLEEIDDVDVVRDAKSSTISFKSSKPTKIAVEASRDTDGEAEVEWEGFSEEEEQPAEEELKKAENREKKSSRSKKPEPRKPVICAKTTDKTNVDGSILNGKGLFELLADRPMDDEDTTVDISAWHSLGLSPETLDSLSRLKFSQPTPIQSSAIPEILTGHDVVGKASTGSGKTLAFGIPILEAFLALSRKGSGSKSLVALIVSPTRELALQITTHLAALCSDGDFDAPCIATITGGLSIQKQRRLLEKANVIVGTPGRLWEVISSGHGLLKSLRQIRFLVVDEADRLLSEGLYKELGEILNVLDQKDDEDEDAPDDGTSEEKVERQTLIFSATFHKGLQQKLAGKANRGGDLMNQQESMEYLLKKLHFREEKPKFIDVNRTSQMAAGLKEGLIECAGTEKDLYLYALLLFHPKNRALIFTNSISAVRRLTPFLQNLNLPAVPLHSQMQQKARLRSVERFTQRPGSILVATDVAARGLDIPAVQLILHYHLPRAADTYVHRSGRTARAEASGSSILICAPEEVAGVRRLVVKVHAQGAKSKKDTFIRTLDIDRRIVSRLKPRASLSKRLADATLAKEKYHGENDFLREAAEDLGVDYDSDALDADAKGRKGRGNGRKKKEKEARSMTKAEMQALRAELKSLLSQRVNAGVSARYLTSGGIDVEALLRGEGNAEFLGEVGGLGLDEEV